LARPLFFFLKISFVLACLANLSPRVARAQEALPKSVPAPADNPPTSDKIELGKQLYFDPRLSATGAVSCNSCHNVMAGGDDNRSFSVGVQGKLGGRSSPTVWNAAFQSVQFWDGRAATLEEQAKGPLINPLEMGMESHDAVVARLRKIPGYVRAFERVFNGAAGGAGGITIDNAAKAIAAYERTLVTPGAPFDRFIKGDKKALSAEAKKGYASFQSIGCIGCHNGINFSGPALPAGTGFYQKFPTFPDAELEAKYLTACAAWPRKLLLSALVAISSVKAA
jgi:cytochrome c peroxidase